MDNFKVIYRILRYLEKAMDLEEVDTDRISAEALKISEQRWISIIEMLVKDRYIDGVLIKRSSDGYTEVSFSDLRITLRGLEYLQENSLMKKAADLAKGIVDVIT